MNGYESENDIRTYFFEFEYLRDKRCATLDDERDKIDQLIMHTKASDPRANCSVLGLSSKLHLMNSFKESLNVLAARFARTTGPRRVQGNGVPLRDPRQARPPPGASGHAADG